MDVKITVEVDGQLVEQHIEQVDGTLEDMEETIDAMSRRVACSALQASVDSVTAPRPLFLRREGTCVTKATKPGR